MSVKFQVQMTEKYMYDFMLYHNYTSMSGIMGAVAGVLCFGVFIKKADLQSSLVWLMCAILFLVISPYTMKTRAKAQVQNTEMFQKPLEYELTEEGITVRQDEQEMTNAWADFTKAVSTQKSVLLYLGRVRALIFPKECMGDQYEDVIKMIHTHMPATKVKIRHIH